MKEQVKIGFVGAGGFISAHHLATARDCAITEVRAIADINEKVLEYHSSRMSVGYTTTNYRDLLNDKEIDIIVIGTKQDMHAALIVESLDAGKWVLCEKPMANNATEAKAVLAAEKRNPGYLAIGFNRRFAPACRQAKQLMSQAKRPWMVNYRMMNQSSHAQDSYYAKEPRILYEGCHVLDLACWFFESYPEEVYMTGDVLLNNCCILSFADGSQFQFMCGSIGAISFWKENMEIFGQDKSICINDFVDMRVRGFKNEYDRLFGTYRGEHDANIMKYGFDFYDLYRTERSCDYIPDEYKVDWRKLGVVDIPVKRPTNLPFDISEYHRKNTELRGFVPNKGWFESLEHLAECKLTGKKPDNADGKAGAAATLMAMCLLESLKTRRPVNFRNNLKAYITKPKTKETVNV
jgi:predicted dehydrogenase